MVMCLNHCFPRYLLFLRYGITKPFTEADALQFHTAPEAGAWPRSEGWCRGTYAPEPRGAAAAARGLAGGGSREGIQRRECLEAEGGGGRGREGRRERVQGRMSRLKNQARRCISILPAISYSLKPPPLLAALAGWGGRMWSQLLTADVPPALAGVPKYLIQGGAILLGWIKCCQLLGEWSKKQGDWSCGRLFMFARGV